jgi:hypothetical protein
LAIELGYRVVPMRYATGDFSHELMRAGTS